MEVERLTLKQKQNQGGAQQHSLQPGSVGGGPQQNQEEEIERLKKVASTLSSQLPVQKERVELTQQKLKQHTVVSSDVWSDILGLTVFPLLTLIVPFTPSQGEVVF